LVQLLLSKYAIETWLNFSPHLFNVYTYITLENFETLEITNSAVGKNEVNCTLFVHDFFQSDKKLTISVQNVFYLDAHMLSVSFSIRWWSRQ